MTHPADEAVLRRMVGIDTFARGRQYASNGSVLYAQWDPDGGRVFGQVRGHARRPYSALAILGSSASGALRSFEGTCTCPVGKNCKHSVALALTRRPVVEPTWRQRLTGVRPARPADSYAEVALQVDWVEQLGSTPRVELRPVLRGRSGGWIRTGISWSTLYLHDHAAWGRAALPPRHLRLLHEVAALHATDPATRFAGLPAAIDMCAVASRRVWDLLGEAVDFGMPLVPAGKRAAAVLLHRDAADLTLDLSRADGAVALQPALVVNDQTTDVNRAALIGSPAHGVAWCEEGNRPVLHLARLAGEVDDGVRELIDGEPIHIPEPELEEFFASYYPALRRRVRLTSRTGSVELPETQPPGLTLTVEHQNARQVSLRWEWAYRVGSSVRTEPLWPNSVDADREPDVETALLAPVLTIMAPLESAHEAYGSVRRLAPAATLRDAATIEFVTTLLPRLEQLPGLAVETLGEPVDYRPVDGPTQIDFTDTTRADTSDWFDLTVTVTVGGHELPYELLFVALATGQRQLILPDGRYLDLDRPELHELAKVISEARELHDAPPRTIRVNRFQASVWEELDALGEVSGPATHWRDTVRALTDTSRLDDVAPPAELCAQLRPYQRDGLRWLAFLYRHGLGGVLADDMGLGKTVQTLAAICHVKHRDPDAAPFLIVAPTSVMSNWRLEAQRFTPDLRTVVISETFSRRGVELAEIADNVDVVVTSYNLFRLEFDDYAAISWSGLVLDEAQAAKNHPSRNYACAKQLSAPVKLAITGTPMENNLAELWALLSITAPGLFPSLRRFEEHFRRPIERDRDADAMARLRQRIRPLMLRRTKDEVAADLPDKQEQVLEVELSARHRRAYQTLLNRERHKVLGLLDDMQGNRFEILRSLTLLRQASLDMSLVDPAAANIPPTKVDVLADLLDEITADGHRTLVFSQFTGFLASVRNRLDANGVEYCYLDGSTRNRASVIADFKTGTAPVFLISLKAGGVGLNLVEADYCVILDPWWNPATEAQAVDRTHRIGQTRKVMVYRLIAKDTIEEKVAALKDRKAALFHDVLDGGTFASARLTADDIRAMLA